MPTATVTPIRPVRVYPGTIGVHVRTGMAYRVVSAGTKNYRAATYDGTEYNIPLAGLRPASVEEVEAFTALEPPPVFFYAGNVVRFKPGGKAPSGIYVVTKETTTGYNLSPLGGDLTGKYYRSVPAAKIEKVGAFHVDLIGIANV
jgi:hypothetical protein